MMIITMVIISMGGSNIDYNNDNDNNDHNNDDDKGVMLTRFRWTYYGGELATHSSDSQTIWGLDWQKQISMTGISKYIPQYLWDVITFPCPWYLLWHTRAPVYKFVVIYHTPNLSLLLFFLKKKIVHFRPCCHSTFIKQDKSPEVGPQPTHHCSWTCHHWCYRPFHTLFEPF